MDGLSLAPHEVVAAKRRYASDPRQSQIDAMLSLGIRPWAIAGAPDSGEHGVGFARIAIAGRAFEFVDDGTPAMIVVALNCCGEAADLVGWPIRGGGIASWLGAVSILGAQHLFAPRIEPALPVYRCGLDWLRGDRQGIVIVNPGPAARELRDAEPLLATGGFDHATNLVAALTVPPPRVVIPDLRQERRAA